MENTTRYNKIKAQPETLIGAVSDVAYWYNIYAIDAEPSAALDCLCESIEDLRRDINILVKLYKEKSGA